MRWNDNSYNHPDSCAKCAGRCHSTSLKRKLNDHEWDHLLNWQHRIPGSHRMVNRDSSTCFGCYAVRYISMAKLAVLLYDLKVCKLHHEK